MAKANEIILQLRSENKQLKAGLTEAQGKVKSFSEKAKKSVSGVSASFKALIIGSVGIYGVIRAFKALISITDKQAKAEKQLDAVLASTGHAAGLTAKEIKKMASALQSVTTFGDEAIIEGQNLLLTFTKIGGDIFPRATEAMLNMSVAMKQGMKESAIQLGKALNDPILGLTALRRVGVQLEKSQEELVKKFVKTGEIAKAQKIILKELEVQMGGSAKAAAQTLGGRLKQLDNIGGDVAETFGKTLFSSLQDTFSLIAEGSGTTGTFITRLKLVAKYAAEVVKEILGLTRVLGVFTAMKSAGPQMDMTEFNKFNRRMKTRTPVTTKPTKTAKDTGDQDASKFLKFVGEDELAKVMAIEKQKLELVEKFSTQRVEIEKAAQDKIDALNRKSVEARIQDGLTILGSAQNIVGQISALAQMDTSNKVQALENERLEKQKFIEDTVADEEQRNIQIEALNNEFDRKKKVEQLKGAKLSKKLAIAETIINIPAAAFAAFQALARIPFVGPVLGGLAAAAATALGFAKVAMIKKQPLPTLARGRVPSDHFPAYVSSKEAMINASSTRANADLLKSMNDNPGQRMTGGSQTKVTSIVQIDSREIGRAVNDFRQDEADDSGLTNYGEGTGAM